mgnify:FL=1
MSATSAPTSTPLDSPSIAAKLKESSEGSPLLSSDAAAGKHAEPTTPAFAPLVGKKDAATLLEEQPELVPRLSYKLSVWRKLLFGFGNFSRYASLGVQAYFLNSFLLEVRANTMPRLRECAH